MTRKLLSGLVLVMLLAGGYLLVRNLVTGTRLPAEGNEGGPAGGGPQIVLQGVEMVEARRGGAVYRLLSADASYKIPLGWVLANRVTLAVREQGGEIVISAPAASWKMNEGRIDLADGASAKNERGWTASAPKARVDLKSEVILAEVATLVGPGVTVTGSNLRWRWKDGTVALDSPKSTIFPGNVPEPGRKG